MKMPKSVYILGMTTALGMSPVLADNNDSKTVTVTGTVVANLVLTVNTNITMPDVVVPDSGETSTVDLTCDGTGAGTVTYDALGGNPFAHGTAAATAVDAISTNKFAGGGETGVCGDVGVAGEPNFAYTLTSATNDTSADVAGVTLTGANCVSASDNVATGGTITAGGTDTIYCGAAVSVADTASAGAYTSLDLNVDVVYD